MIFALLSRKWEIREDNNFHKNTQLASKEGLHGAQIPHSSRRFCQSLLENSIYRMMGNATYF